MELAKFPLETVLCNEDLENCCFFMYKSWKAATKRGSLETLFLEGRQNPWKIPGSSYFSVMLQAEWYLYKIRTLHGYFSRILLKLLSFLTFIFVKFRKTYIQGKPLPVSASGSFWNYFWKSKQTSAKATRKRTQKNVVNSDIQEFRKKSFCYFSLILSSLLQNIWWGYFGRCNGNIFINNLNYF